MPDKQYLEQGVSFDPQTGLFNFDINNGSDYTLQPEIILFEADRHILVDEKPIVIRWDVRNANLIFINQVAVASAGEMPFHSLEPLTIALVAKNKSNCSVQKQLFIDIDRTPPTIHFFKADKLFAIQESAVTLSWSVSGAKEININNKVGKVSAQSEVTVFPFSNQAYRIVAESYFGYISDAEITISVFPKPLIKDFSLPLPELINYDRWKKEIKWNSINVKTDISFVQSPLNLPRDILQIGLVPPKIILEPPFINTVLYPNSILEILLKKQKEVSYLIRSLWKKKLKTKLRKVI